MTDNRNRSQGWQYAKITGHTNEKMIAAAVKTNTELQKRLLHAAHKDNENISSVEYGGLNEKDVPCVLGGLTKSKSDMKILLTNGESIGVSIKKSFGGQVYLISAKRFIAGYEKQFNTIIPVNVKTAILLFWGCSDSVPLIIEQYSTKNKKYESKKHRIVAETLKLYSKELYDCLINWFSKNIDNVFDYCFSKGLAANSDDWAMLIWYKNDVKEIDNDTLINLNDVKKCFSTNVEYGTRTGGSTIQLPFGFVQWHSPTKKIPGDMQFHHSYTKILESIEQYCNFYNIPFDKNNPTNNDIGEKCDKTHS